MTGAHGWRGSNSPIRWTYEILLALNVAFVTVSVVFSYWPALSIPFAHLEVYINEALRIPQSDLIRGYFEFAIPSIMLAALLWAVLRISAGTRMIQQFLRIVAGLAILFVPAGFWIYAYEHLGWPVRWPYRGAPLELAVVFVFALLFLSDRWPIPNWCGLLILLAHYAFWYWAPSTNPAMPNYSGPAAPILGLCASLAWGFYISRLRRSRENTN